VHSSASVAGNVDALFFMLRWALCSFHTKCTGTCYMEYVFLHPVGSVGHVVHSVASGVRSIDTLFFMLQWAQHSFHKKHDMTCYTELVFSHPI
jgi:hypothetical protein